MTTHDTGDELRGRITSIEELRRAVDEVIGYCWDNELDDYRKCSDVKPEANQRAGHIFETLVALDNWVRGTRHALESYVEGP